MKFDEERCEKIRACAYENVMSFIPPALEEKIKEILSNTQRGKYALSEVHVQSGSVSMLIVGGEMKTVSVNITSRDIEDCIFRMTNGELYRHRESIARGYISIGCGVRVGVVGAARYEGGKIIGVERISRLVFRLPYFDINIGRKICAGIPRDALASALIYSPPAVGKTTALRALAAALSERRYTRIAIIDTRYEFPQELYEGSGVMILAGYEKAYGTELATRLLNPEIIFMDEIGAEDAGTLSSCLLSGIPVVASAHAASAEELRSRRGIGELISIGAFDMLIGIYRRDGEYRISVSRGGVK